LPDELRSVIARVIIHGASLAKPARQNKRRITLIAEQEKNYIK
jgi:hypothetical protein